MELEELIQNLVREPKTKRALDDAIAEHLGWTRAYEEIKDDSTGAVSRVQMRNWYPANGDNLTRVPNYTTDLQIALNLVAQLAPRESIGVSWGKDEPAHAILGGGLTLQAATPPMAVCAAAMLHLWKKRKAEELIE